MAIGYCGAVAADTLIQLATVAGDGVGPPIAGAGMGRTRRPADNQIIQSAHGGGPVPSLLRWKHIVNGAQ